MIPNDYLDGHPAWKAREARLEANIAKAYKPPVIPTAPVDVAWVDDNDGRGPVKLSNSVRCF